MKYFAFNNRFFFTKLKLCNPRKSADLQKNSISAITIRGLTAAKMKKSL